MIFIAIYRFIFRFLPSDAVSLLKLDNIPYDKVNYFVAIANYTVMKNSY